MTTTNLPLTAPGPLWSQREYVLAVTQGIGFASHHAGDITQHFHYRLPEGRCCTLKVGPGGVRRRVDHAFVPRLDWITQCQAAMNKKGA